MTKKSPSEVQAKKFLNAARKLGEDVPEERFDEALKRIGKAKLTHPPRPAKPAKKEKAAD